MSSIHLQFCFSLIPYRILFQHLKRNTSGNVSLSLSLILNQNKHFTLHFYFFFPLSRSSENFYPAIATRDRRVYATRSLRLRFAETNRSTARITQPQTKQVRSSYVASESPHKLAVRMCVCMRMYTRAYIAALL